MAIGIAIGSIIGVVQDNIGAWIAIGLAYGAGLGSRWNQKKKEDGDNGAPIN